MESECDMLMELLTEEDGWYSPDDMAVGEGKLVVKCMLNTEIRIYNYV